MNKTLQNVIFNVLYQVLNIIIPLVTAPYIARVMGADGVGVYSYSTSVAGYFAIFMLLGVANYGSRTIAMERKKGRENISRVFSEVYLLQFVVSAVVLVCYIYYVRVWARFYQTALYAQVFYLISVLLDISWYFAGTGQFRITVTRGVLIRVIETLMIFFFVKGEQDIITYVLIMSVGTLLGNVVLWPVVLKQVQLLGVSAHGVLRHMKPTLVLFLPLLASSVFIYMDKIMLHAITADISELGLYEYAEKIVRLPLSIISAIGAVMMPKISSHVHREEQGQCEYYMDISMRYIALVSAAMCFGIMAIAPELAIVYLGVDFASCGTLMQMLSCIIVISSFANVLRTQYLIPRCHDYVYVGSIIAGAVVNLILNAVCIPLLGARGAAIGTIGAELAVAAGHIIGVNGRMNLAKYVGEWSLALVCGGAMLLVVRMAGMIDAEPIASLFCEFTAGVLSYVVFACAVLYYKKDEFFLKILHRVKK